MEATETLTSAELEARLVEQQHEVEEAERALGAAALEDQSPKTAAKRLQDARTAVTLTEGALNELERREHARVEAEAARHAAEARRETYTWAARYCRLAEVVICKQRELTEAENALRAHGVDNKLYRRKTNLDGLDAHGGGDLDMDLVHAIPFGRKSSGIANTAEYVGRLALKTEDDCRRWAERADELAAIGVQSLSGVEAEPA
jgi:hypothetical protein